MSVSDGSWTDQKIAIVVAYTKAYLERMKSRRYWKLLYFDGFSGSGKTGNKETDGEKGIGVDAAKRILRINEPNSFDMYYFIDKKKKFVDKLQRTIDTEFPSKKFNSTVETGDCNKKLRDLAAYLQGSDSNHKALAFIDPCGMQLKWKSIECLKGLNIDWFTLRDLPNVIRKGEWTVTAAVWMDKEIIKVWPGRVEDYYGIAIDVGTTTIAAYFCNMRTMEVLDTVSMMNPQCKYGEDVMARITYHMQNPGGLERMSDDLIEGLNGLIKKACEGTHPPRKKKKDDNGKVVKDEEGNPVMVEAPEEGKTYLRLSPSDIVDLTLGGNTAMHHIMLKLDPQYVGLAPFPPVVHRSLDIRARDLGININKSSNVFVMPNEAGFVGADNVCVLGTEKPHMSDELQLIIDIGTNGELVLGNRDKLISSSCATGPALEGAQLAFGMRAAPGAIERIKIDPDTHDVDYKVIGREAWLKYSKPEEMKTKGICGSGILDVLAELYRSGVVAKSGRFSKDQKSDRFRKNPDNPRQKEFVIAWANETSIGKDVVITQKDVRQIQLAKGALYTGCKLMMRRMGIDKVDTIKIAGAFGTHVAKDKALIMGLFPDCDLDNVMSVGNAAGDGARVVLLDRTMRDDANWISRNVEYIELTVEKDFEQQFMESMQIPHMTDEFPHLQEHVPQEILHQK